MEEISDDSWLRVFTKSEYGNLCLSNAKGGAGAVRGGERADDGDGALLVPLPAEVELAGEDELVRPKLEKARLPAGELELELELEAEAEAEAPTVEVPVGGAGALCSFSVTTKVFTSRTKSVYRAIAPDGDKDDRSSAS